MTDLASFTNGGATYPLPTGGSGLGGLGATLLRDADPASFYLIEFFKSVLETHIAGRFMQEVASCGASDRIQTTVAETLPINPLPYLTQGLYGFPLLAAYRKHSKYKFVGQRKLTQSEFEVVYILPPLQPGEAERLEPILQSVVAVIDNRTEQGMDPAYTPSAPTGTAGELIWDRAGIAKAGVTEASFGGYPASPEVYYPAITISLEVEEQSAALISELDVFDGADVEVDHEDPDTTTVTHVADFETHVAPTVTSVSPNTGTKAGGTSVTITGTGFRVGTTPFVYFGGKAATNVVVASATSVTCSTPAHSAYDTFAADLVVLNADGQSGTLENAFMFTTP